MTPAKVLIVEDERLARLRIRRLLAGNDEVEIVAEATNAAQASRAIRRERPDLAFVDIHLPDADGLEMLRGIEPELMPVVIFATAFDAYAIDAFEIHALDYLLKPFDDERFEQALERGITEVRQRQDDGLRERLRRLLDNAPGAFPSAT